MSAHWDLPPLGSAASHRMDTRLHGGLSLTFGIFALLLSFVSTRPVPLLIVGSLALLGALPALLLDPAKTSRASLTAGHLGAAAGNVFLAWWVGRSLSVTTGPLVLVIIVLHAACFRSPRETWLHVAWGSALFAALAASTAGWRMAVASWGLLTIVLAILAFLVTGLRARVDALLLNLHHLASHDPLTRLLNREGLRRAALALSRTSGEGTVAVVLLDVDHFKRLNDEHGHQAGDVALAWLGALLLAALPPPALVARFGGEEFLVLLPSTDADAAFLEGQRLCALVETEGRRQQPHPFTVSVGTAVGSLESDLSEYYRCADQALYRAKRAGRNRAERGLIPEPRDDVQVVLQ